MCDTIINRNVDAPDFAYKILQKISPGVYLTPLIGQTITLGEWTKALELKKVDRYVKLALDPQFADINAHYGSSNWDENHVGMFAVFRTLDDVFRSALSNAMWNKETGNKLPSVVARVMCRGKCHETRFHDVSLTYLVEEIYVHTILATIHNYI